MKVTTPLISTGCNRHPSAADWRPSTGQANPTGLVAYAARNTIALWNPEDSKLRGVRRVLKGHVETVNAVRWVSIPVYSGEEVIGEETVLLSGSGGVVPEIGVWVQRGEGEGGEEDEDADVDYVMAHMEGVGGSINDFAAVTSGVRESGSGRKGRVVATAGADGVVAVWEIVGERSVDAETAETSTSSPSRTTSIHLEKLQSITTKPKFLPLSLSLCTLPKSSNEALVLAVAGSINIIQIYVSSYPGEEFSLRATLAGHENWVRSLAFTHENVDDPEGSDVLLASASQDKYIRLWRVHQGHDVPTHGGKSNLTDGFGAVGAGRSGLSNKAHRFYTSSREEGLSGKEYSVTFEALLVGHEDWIYTIRWRTTSSSSPAEKGLQLLSASADNSVSLWSPDEDSGIWLSTVRLGEISDQKGSSTATGSVGGLWIGLWSPTGERIAALGKTGGWRMWGYDESEDRWTARVATTGHVRDVTGVGWGGPNSEWLISTSLDQTTRVWARWRKEGGKGGWHEFARPQVHGYDINCITWLPRLQGKGGYQFVSGADEKLLRIFEEPKGVAVLLKKLSGSSSSTTTATTNSLEEEEGNIDSLPEGAEQPVLGLSNKTLGSTSAAPVPSDTPHSNEESTTSSSINKVAFLASLTHPPLEDHLSRHTLFPEVEKLYGHGYEISSVTSAHTLPLIATSCRASSTEHAGIRLFDTAQGREIKPPLVGGHNLTVLRMDFTDDDQFLLSVSRDRTWVVYQKRVASTENNSNPKALPSLGYTIVSRQPAKGGHSRVVWDGKWAPLSQNSKRVFATGSRDKSVKIWVWDNCVPNSSSSGEEEEVQFVNTATIKFPVPVTSLAFVPEIVGGKFILAVGLENGGITLCEARCENLEEWSRNRELRGEITPAGTVLEMSWRKRVDSTEEEDKEGRELAVAAEDGSVRVYKVKGLEACV